FFGHPRSIPAERRRAKRAKPSPNRARSAALAWRALRGVSGPSTAVTLRARYRGALPLRALGLFPVAVQLLQGEPVVGGGGGPAAVGLVHARLHVGEAPGELVDGAPEGALGVEVDVARQVDQGEEDVAQLGLDAVLVAGGDGLVELAEL